MIKIKWLLPLLCLLVLSPALQADTPFSTEVYLNGSGAGEVQAVFSEGRLYVDAKTIAHMLQAALMDPGTDAVTLNSRPIARVRRVNQTPFVDVVDTLVALGLKGEIRENGAALSIWSVQGLSQRLELALSLSRSDKGSSPIPNFESRFYSISVRNQSKSSAILTGEQFFVIDSNDDVYDCETEFETPLQAGQTSALDRLLFEVPAGKDVKFLVVLQGDLEIARLRLP